MKEDFFITEVVEFNSIIRTKTEESKTTRIKVIDNFYPLVGEVKVEPNDSLKILKNKPDTILIDKTTKSNLDLKLGDKIKIQNVSFEVIGVIESLPDIGGLFIFGDHALINKSSLKRLKINNLGSFINFKYKMLAKGQDKKLSINSISKNENFLIKHPEDISQNLKKLLKILYIFYLLFLHRLF